MTETVTKRIGKGSGFTLIELLMVIAVMGILAGLTIGVIGPVSNSRKRKGMEADLKRLVTAIENYKAKFGHYPPDNATKRNINNDWEWMHPLYYELTGTLVVNNSYFQPMDGAYLAQQGGSGTALEGLFGVRGLINSSVNRPNVKVFLSDLRPGHMAVVKSDLVVLTATVPGPNMNILDVNGTPINPWRYNATSPTHNPGKFDLWAEVVIGSDTNVIGNWHK